MYTQWAQHTADSKSIKSTDKDLLTKKFYCTMENAGVKYYTG